jgi:hypothetical protein
VNAWLTVLTSAAVGVLVSGIVTLLGQHIERKAKRRELLFTQAVELARLKTDLLVAYSKDTRQPAAIHDYVAYAEMYHWLLKGLYDDGGLPKGWRDEIKKRFPLP